MDYCDRAFLKKRYNDAMWALSMAREDRRRAKYAHSDSIRKEFETSWHWDMRYAKRCIQSYRKFSEYYNGKRTLESI